MSLTLELTLWLALWAVVSVVIGVALGKLFDDGVDRGAGGVGDTRRARWTEEAR